ncbi:MAG: RNA methyltransferase [Syntrophaceae bacterium]
MSLYIALLHHPVYNRNGQVVTTAIANMDIHDIARAAATYGVEKFFIVNPQEEQKELAAALIRHWQEGYGAQANPSRKEAFERVCLMDSLERATGWIESDSGTSPKIAVTGAALGANLVSWQNFRKLLQERDGPYLLLFGTGWGIAREVIDCADYRLPPLAGPSSYNHLSVRSAVSIALDRLMGINRP